MEEKSGREKRGLNVYLCMYVSFKKVFEEYFDKMLVTSVKSGTWDMRSVVFF